ncbi:MAG: alginate lyase family protein [Bacteroidota bacterium]
MALIENYVEKDHMLKDGLEPYPISLRGINWIKFLSKHGINNTSVRSKLYQHYLRLKDNLEYHLLGNHLLENGFSMLFGAYYFKNEEFYNIAYKILNEELKEQILDDGAHYELSPMYHQILLYRLLDCINLINQNNWKKDGLSSFLDEKASKMLGWLRAVTYQNGNVPMVNDCAYDIAPDSKQLFDYAQYLGVTFTKSVLRKSGYRKFVTEYYELFVDVGNLGPDYQLGHAHSDTLSFELCVNQKPVLVDTGTSTYEKNDIRQTERGTAAHNSVKIDDYEQSDIWGGFRVARRAKAYITNETEREITAYHTGYKKLGITHTRKFETKPENVVVHDRVISSRNDLPKQYAFFHFHPGIGELLIEGNKVVLPVKNIELLFSGTNLTIDKMSYQYAIGFNRTLWAEKIRVNFRKELKTQINIFRRE